MQGLYHFYEFGELTYFYIRHLQLDAQLCDIGALDGGSLCRLSILRNANVAGLCRLFKAMSPVDFKK